MVNATRHTDPGCLAYSTDSISYFCKHIFKLEVAVSFPLTLKAETVDSTEISCQSATLHSATIYVTTDGTNVAVLWKKKKNCFNLFIAHCRLYQSPCKHTRGTNKLFLPVLVFVLFWCLVARITCGDCSAVTSLCTFPPQNPRLLANVMYHCSNMRPQLPCRITSVAPCLLLSLTVSYCLLLSLTVS